jgi:hypothetical protein
MIRAVMMSFVLSSKLTLSCRAARYEPSRTSEMLYNSHTYNLLSTEYESEEYLYFQR